MTTRERVLTAEFDLRLGRLDLHFDLTVGGGEVVALLGPNGAGKTTVLRALAGLQSIGNGHVTIAGRTVDRPDEGVFVHAESRRVGVVFQDYLLFPHLSVLENVAFGPRARGASRSTARAEATTWIERVGLAAFATAKPSTLSGGQAQRVALARALASRPTLLLLDEPLAALDASTKAATRRDLRRHLSGFTGGTVIVSHDPLDALALADRVVVVESGSVTQVGSIAEVTTRPRTDYVAELLGVNLLRGEADGSGAILLEDGTDSATPMATARDRPHVHIAGHAHGPTNLLVRPRAVALHRSPPETSAQRLAVRGPRSRPTGKSRPGPPDRRNRPRRGGHTDRRRRTRTPRGHTGVGVGEGDRRDTLPCVSAEASATNTRQHKLPAEARSVRSIEAPPPAQHATALHR
ncbi:MAG: ABC transporter ATP-binding protein [Microthrixaceae bacterium]